MISLRVVALLCSASLFALHAQPDLSLLRNGNYYLSWQDAASLALLNLNSSSCQIPVASRSLLSPAVVPLPDVARITGSLPKKARAVAERLQALKQAECERLVLMEVADAYGNALRALEGMKIAREAQDVNEVYYKVVQDAVHIGAMPPLELSLMQVEMAQSRMHVAQAEKDISAQSQRLYRLINATHVPVQSNVIITDIYNIPASEAVRNIDDLIKTALEKRPDYLFQQVWLEATESGPVRRKNALATAALTISSEIQEMLTDLKVDRATYDAAVPRRRLSEQVMDDRQEPFPDGYQRGIYPLSSVLTPHHDLTDARQEEIAAGTRYFIDSNRLKLIVGERPAGSPAPRN